MISTLGTAVEETHAYSRRFGLPLTSQKLHRWLIYPKPVSLQDLQPYLPTLTIADRKLINKRLLVSKKKLAKVKRIARFLGLVPTIKLVCATGSLAIDNARLYDDLDIFIVTSANSLWLTRAIVITCLKFFNLRRPTSIPEHYSLRVADKVCDNLWLDETALALPENKKNLYTAHEVLQAKPIFDRGGYYQRFINQNSWTKNYLANAYKAISLTFENSKIENCLKIENCYLKIINDLAFRFQYHYMKPKISNETITLHSAYFHPNEYGLINSDG